MTILSQYIIVEQKWNQIGRAVQEEGFRPNGKREIVTYPEIKYDNMIPSQVGTDLRRSRSWASNGGEDIFKKARMVLMTSQEVVEDLLNYLKK